jgi:hypothetical protein
MKNTAIILGFLFQFFIAQGQITFENSFPASATLTELSVSGHKYYLMDVTNNQCRIYNTDYSLWKTVPLNIPGGNYLYNIIYVSENLFNLDNKTELAYTYYSYDTTLLYYSYTSKIINEDGVELLNIPGCSYIEVKGAGSQGFKLLAYTYDYSVVPYTINTIVFSLPGSLPTGETAAIKEFEGVQNAFPNPASWLVTIPYNLPKGIKAAQLLLISGSGRLLRTYQIDCTSHELNISVENLPKGVYLYQLKTDKAVLGAGKFIHN